MHRDDADQILTDSQHDRDEAVAVRDGLLHAVENALLELAQRMTIDPLIGDDRKLRGVDRVGPFAQNLALRTFLATADQKPAHILKVGFVLGVVGGEHLGSSQRSAVAREHIGDLALPDRDEIGGVDSIGERKKRVDTTAQDLGLEPGLAMQCDKAGFDRSFSAPTSFRRCRPDCSRCIERCWKHAAKQESRR